MDTKFKVILHYSDGSDEEMEELYDTKRAAEEAGLYAMSCYRLGGEILHESNPGDYPYDEDDELVEVEDISAKKFDIEKNYTKLNQYKYSPLTKEQMVNLFDSVDVEREDN